MEPSALCVAVIGSRGIRSADLSRYIPKETTQIVSGGATGVDTLAEQYAAAHQIPIRILRPQYSLYGKRAPLFRNRQIVECADLVIAVWDGRSSGTAYTIDYAHERGVPVRIYIPEGSETDE